jgi:hypothetical protein
LRGAGPGITTGQGKVESRGGDAAVEEEEEEEGEEEYDEDEDEDEEDDLAAPIDDQVCGSRATAEHDEHDGITWGRRYFHPHLCMVVTSRGSDKH